MLIYYINLDGRQDRRLAMEHQFERLGLTAQRIKALTPAQLNPDDRKNYSDPKRYFWLTGPELACSFSHLSALGHFVKSDAPICLIFEDDVVISTRLKGFIEAFENAPPVLDLLRIESSNYPLRLARKPLAEYGKTQILQFYSWCAGSAGYIVSRDGAQRIIAGQEIRKTQADRALFNPYEPLARELKIMLTLPALCKQKNSISPGATSNTASDLAPARQDRSTMERAHSVRRAGYSFLKFLDRELRIGSLKMWNQTIKGATKRAVPFETDQP